MLSFADEEEEEEREIDALPIKLFKGKSSHELTDDPKLSSTPAVSIETDATKRYKFISYFIPFLLSFILCVEKKKKKLDTFKRKMSNQHLILFEKRLRRVKECTLRITRKKIKKRRRSKNCRIISSTMCYNSV